MGSNKAVRLVRRAGVGPTRKLGNLTERERPAKRPVPGDVAGRCPDRRDCRTTRRSQSTVRGWVDHRRKKGEDLKLRRARNREGWPKIQRLWLEGKTHSKIAETLGTARDNVGTAIDNMRRAGLDMPRRRA